MKIVYPMVGRFLGVPPGSILSLASAAVENGLTSHVDILRVARVFPAPGKHGCAEKVRVVNRALTKPGIAKATAGRSELSRKTKDPSANAFRNIEVFDLFSLLVGFEKGLANQAGQYDRGRVRPHA